ncbi:nucleosome assembly protein 1-like 1-A [Drosophila obscura]|uniref:nucleosome assembly protein 1-like 1-A n=1 Tax=Drosophila obscura TaxID=7282 RepID=UPI001BB2845B|nr:nucleosome assembly protein 1-like 1-A [Drosophila obscura]
MDWLVRRQYLREMVKALPASVQNRLVVLKNLQVETLKIEAEFYEEVKKLEQKYQLKYQPLFDKRKEVVVGTVDPAVEKPNWTDPEDPLTEFKWKSHFIKSLKIFKSIRQDTTGIPAFWLTIFRNVAILSQMIESCDVPALLKLTDVAIKYDDGHSYTLEFHFDKNAFFSNTVLTKRYVVKSSVDPDSPFAFEGPEIASCSGCEINWKKKMDLTVHSTMKTQKHKERGTVRYTSEQVPMDTFFNFFNTPEDPVDVESRQILAADFEIGHFLRSQIIPKAVLYFTGDIVDGMDDDDSEEEEEED